jgi:hypothetical protein
VIFCALNQDANILGCGWKEIQQLATESRQLSAVLGPELNVILQLWKTY